MNWFGQGLAGQDRLDRTTQYWLCCAQQVRARMPKLGSSGQTWTGLLELNGAGQRQARLGRTEQA